MAWAILLGLGSPSGSNAQSTDVVVQFETLFGGTGNEIWRALALTSDGGFVAAGYSGSFNADPTDSTEDVLLVKTDRNGVEQWRAQYGDAFFDERPKGEGSLIQAPDGGFVVAFSDANGPLGLWDAGLLKISASGVFEWAHHYGGEAYDEGTSPVLTPDGGFLLVGATYSSSIPGYQSQNDYLVVKTDSLGNLAWQFAYGRLGGVGTSEAAYKAQLAGGGGYLVNGLSFGHPGGGQRITIHIDVNGVKLSEVVGELPVPTPDGGSIVATNSTAGAGNRDFYLEKRDASGTLEWARFYGDVNDDVLNTIDLTSDGGYLLGGYFGSTPTSGAGNEDIWIIKTDSLGSVEWDFLIGQGSDDAAFAVRETADGSFALVGYVEDWPPPQGLGGRDMYMAVLEEIVDPGYITGTAYFDLDAGCSRDLPQEFGAGFTLIRAVDLAASKTYFGQTDPGGQFEITVPPGNYEVSAVGTAIRQETCNSGTGIVYSVTVAEGDTVGDNDFGIQPGLHGSCTIEGRPIPTNPPTLCGGAPFQCPPGQSQATACPGFPWMYCTTYTNIGSIPFSFPTSLDIEVSKPELFNCSTGNCDGVVSDTCQFQKNQSTAHGWDWTLDPGQALAPGASCEICVQVDVVGSAPYLNTASIDVVPPTSSTVLNGSGTHLPIPVPNSPNPARVSPVYSGASVGAWAPPAHPAWVGSFAVMGSLPGTSGPGVASFDFASLGGLPSQSIFTLGDLDSGVGFPELATFEAFDASGARLEEWLDRPFSVDNAISANDTPGWSYDSVNHIYSFDGGGVIGNRSVVARMKNNQEIHSLKVNRITPGFGFAIDAPLGTVFQCSVVEEQSCSCDPNDLTVMPRGCPPTGDIQHQPLTYKIRFQNVGAGPATDVVIRDRLDPNLDLESWVVQGSTHTPTGLEVDAEGELVIFFEGLELPPEVTDPEGSQGSVTFRITPLENLADGTVITNSAAIYFDDNPPVITNTVSNTIYNGDPVPIAAFDIVEDGAERYFVYTGGTADATFEWTFGLGASPETSVDENPSVTYASPGSRVVGLTVTKGSCSSAVTETVEVVNSCIDNDADGFGSPGDPFCLNGPGMDCDDDNDQVNPDADELPNGIDDNCNGEIDEGFRALEIPTSSRSGSLLLMLLLGAASLIVMRWGRLR